MTKKKSENLHAKKRALERYNLTFTKAIRNHFKEQIQLNKGTFVSKQSRRVSLWDVDYSGETYRVVYDKQRHNIVTFLPKEPK